MYDEWPIRQGSESLRHLGDFKRERFNRRASGEK